MNMLIPSPDTIPVSWGYFKLLLMLVFPLHLILMNAMLGSTAIAVYAALKREEVFKELARELGKIIPLLIAFAVNIGIAALLFLQVLYGNMFYASSVLIGAFWIMVIPLLILAYYAAYVFDFRSHSGKKPKTAAICLSLVIFLSIAFLFSNNMTLMLEPENWRIYFTHTAGTALNLDDPMLLPRYLHFMIGGVAVGGLFVALYGKLRKSMDSEVRALAQSIGMRVFTVLTGLQIVAGFIFLLSLRRNVMLLFMGGSMTATVIFVAGLALAIFVLTAGTKGKVYLCAGLVIPLVFVMAVLRDIVRTGYLEPYFSPHLLRLTPQYSPMLIFLAVLVLGIVTIVWLLLKVRESTFAR
jgi:hypothetical protein